MFVLEHINVDRHARGVCVVSQDDEGEGGGVDGVESHVALFKIFEKITGEDISVKRGEFT